MLRMAGNAKYSLVISVLLPCLTPMQQSLRPRHATNSQWQQHDSKDKRFFCLKKFQTIFPWPHWLLDASSCLFCLFLWSHLPTRLTYVCLQQLPSSFTQTLFYLWSHCLPHLPHKLYTHLVQCADYRRWRCGSDPKAPATSLRAACWAPYRRPAHRLLSWSIQAWLCYAPVYAISPWWADPYSSPMHNLLAFHACN